MGSGKTTVGRLVADRLDRRFVDSDAEVEERFGKNGRGLAEEHGVEWLHQVEAEILLAALGGPGTAVVAAAATTADRPDLLQRLQDPGVALVVLDGDAEVLWHRAGGGDHRRSLDLESARRLARRRRETTAPIADMVIDVGGLPPEEVVDRLVGLGAE